MIKQLTPKQTKFLETIMGLSGSSDRTNLIDGHKGYSIYAICKRILKKGSYNTTDDFLRDKKKLDTIRNWYIRTWLPHQIQR